MNQEITLDEGTEDAVEDIAEETVAVSEDRRIKYKSNKKKVFTLKSVDIFFFSEK